MLKSQSISEAGKINEDNVWAEFKRGNQSAYAHIYQTNVQALFDYGMHVHADSDIVKDCIQELFIHIWQRRDSLGKVKNIQGYLMTGLRRKIIDALNAQKKASTFDKRNVTCSFDLPYESDLIDGESTMLRENDLLYAIEKLSPRQKEIVYLVFYKDLSHEEIAEIMSLNSASVYTLTWKAIKALKEQLSS